MIGRISPSTETQVLRCSGVIIIPTLPILDGRAFLAYGLRSRGCKQLLVVSNCRVLTCPLANIEC